MNNVSWNELVIVVGAIFTCGSAVVAGLCWLWKELTAIKLEIARDRLLHAEKSQEFASMKTLEKVEDRLARAIEKLGDRLESLFERNNAREESMFQRNNARE